MNKRKLLLFLAPCSQSCSLSRPPLQSALPPWLLSTFANNCRYSPRDLPRKLSRADPDRTMQGVVRAEGGGVRVIDVIPQHVEGVVHAAAEVEVVEMLGEVLPPAHIQQVAGELVNALQLCGGGGKGKAGKGRMASCRPQLKAQGWQEASADCNDCNYSVHTALLLV